MIEHVTPWRALMGVFFAATAVIVFFRFQGGLGAVVALSDQTPWGIWVGFDILAGVALAASGFTMAAAVYVFRIRRFQPLVRMAILTAMLGYLLFIVGLVLEIGRPWNMWRVITHPNIHSPLYEVAMCVILYTLVLILEFSLVVFERLGWTRLVRLHHKVGVALVIVGVLLSTLHQSTLGTLFTIAPHKMHPLWYSEIQPVHFFTSCIAAGLGMVAYEAFLSYRFTKHPVRMDLLAELFRAMAVALGIFFAVRIGDIAARGEIGRLVEGRPAAMFWLENLLFVFIPLALILSARHQWKARALFATAFCVVLGLVMHRFNIAVTSFQFVESTGYFPTWQEIVVSISLVCAGFVAAGLAVAFLPMHPEEPPPADDRVLRIPWRAPG